jgi:hypothetical protein
MTGEYIRPPDVAELTGLTVAALAQLRYKGKGPRYYKPTPHCVLYKPAEVIAWMEASVQSGTALLV